MRLSWMGQVAPFRDWAVSAIEMLMADAHCNAMGSWQPMYRVRDQPDRHMEDLHTTLDQERLMSSAPMEDAGMEEMDAMFETPRTIDVISDVHFNRQPCTCRTDGWDRSTPSMCGKRRRDDWASDGPSLY
ncbi:hypothetical protein AB1Y20_002020 [Prymnesium parvum]|uniref:Uncharacterized protein n=1 Tax=Prymnesium parvum TaxID=97485 RepID=A0AB34J7D1_PRYPA|mmetsp:Transcript_24266/g.51501  ORF Transcript_24266/g.51501 Transcript_24266/m.51501 type:complete len:130 (+) Transcript_24266:53-442(+)